MFSGGWSILFPERKFKGRVILNPKMLDFGICKNCLSSYICCRLSLKTRAATHSEMQWVASSDWKHLGCVSTLRVTSQSKHILCDKVTELPIWKCLAFFMVTDEKEICVTWKPATLFFFFSFPFGLAWKIHKLWIFWGPDYIAENFDKGITRRGTEPLWILYKVLGWLKGQAE